MVKSKSNNAPVTHQVLELLKSVPTVELELVQAEIANQKVEREIYQKISKLVISDITTFFQDVEGMAISANRRSICEMLPVIKQLALDGMPSDAYDEEYDS